MYDTAQLYTAIHQMASYGDGEKWERISQWQLNNSCIQLMVLHSNVTFFEAEHAHTIFHDTNCCESIYYRLKTLSALKCLIRTALALVHPVLELHYRDRMDAKSIVTTCLSEGIQYVATPAWQRSQEKARKRYANEIICVDGATVNAS